MKLMKAMSPDDEADILQLLPEELAEDILNRLKASESEEMETLMAYPENSAGGLMIPDVFALHEDTTVGEAIAKAAKTAGGTAKIKRFVRFTIGD